MSFCFLLTSTDWKTLLSTIAPRAALSQFEKSMSSGHKQWADVKLVKWIFKNPEATHQSLNKTKKQQLLKQQGNIHIKADPYIVKSGMGGGRAFCFNMLFLRIAKVIFPPANWQSSLVYFLGHALISSQIHLF